LTTLPPSCADYLEIWEPQPPGTFRACPGLYRDCFTSEDEVIEKDGAIPTTPCRFQISLLLYLDDCLPADDIYSKVHATAHTDLPVPETSHPRSFRNIVPTIFFFLQRLMSVVSKASNLLRHQCSLALQ
jgi:hypothetical protein